jgi:hypothetical protein
LAAEGHDRIIVQNNPINLIDPMGLVWFRPPGAPFHVGRPGTPVQPGVGIGAFLENNIPGMHDMGYLHDNMVRDLRNAGVPDWLANIPTMPIAYIAAFIGNFGPGFTSYPNSNPCP